MGLLLKNARIVNADKAFDRPMDILCENGKIAKIAERIDAKGHETVDVSGKTVTPGLIDIHVHFRVPGQEHKETIETGSRSAAKGGFTTVMCMPNTDPVIDHAEVVEAIINESREVGLVNVIPIGAITKGQKDEELVDMFELQKAGCLALSDDGKSVNNSQMMRLAMEYSKMTGLLLIEHCQDPLLTSCGVMNESYISTLLGMRGDAGIAETVIVARDIELAKYLNVPVHMAHMSLRRSVELIRTAKAQGIPVTAEVTPHHFTLTDEAVKEFDPNTKMNPPLRSADDVEALKEGLRDGTIDCIATDHAPHTIEDKERGFDHAPFGIIGLETSVGLAVTELLKKGYLTVEGLVEKMSAAPARLVGLKTKGCIKEGLDADITVLDLDQEWTVERDGIVSKSKNTPFIGRKLTGTAVLTVCGGRISYRAL